MHITLMTPPPIPPQPNVALSKIGDIPSQLSEAIQTPESTTLSKQVSPGKPTQVSHEKQIPKTVQKGRQEDSAPEPQRCGTVRGDVKGCVRLSDW